MSTASDVVRTLRDRLREVERQLGSLLDEADELRDVLRRLDDHRPRQAAGRRGARSATAMRRRSRPSTRARRGPTRPSVRAPRGQTRQTILEALGTEAKTAGQIATEKGLNRASVSTTLAKLAKDGAAVKADRGYRAA
jgi:predicted Rossmann fold nucleotide-binding protein DprA/Smf involved in DNA uptake